MSQTIQPSGHQPLGHSNKVGVYKKQKEIALQFHAPSPTAKTVQIM
jgi:hypothetical protein